MTATITPVSQHDSATLTRAVAGERMMMDGGASPLATILQKFADRTDFARDAVAFGRAEGAGSFSVDAGGSNSSFTVRIGAISRVVTYRSGTTTYKVFSYAGGTIGASKISGGGNLANSDWYFCYAYDNAGTLDFELSTTEPNANLCIKTGDSTRVYIGCFPTLSTGAPVPLRASRGRYVYDVGGSALADMAVVTAGAATAYTSVPCATLAPSHVRLATLDVRGTLPAGAGVLASAVLVQSYGATGAMAHTLYNGVGVAFEANGTVFDVVLDASQRAQYKVTGGANAPTADIYVTGFYE